MFDLETLGLTPEIKSKYEFAEKYQQLAESDRQLDKAIAEVINLLSNAKKKFDTTDIEAINKLIDEASKQLINPKELSFQKLKSYCGFRGIEAKGKTSKQLLEELASI
jgi:hypothetical protein